MLATATQHIRQIMIACLGVQGRAHEGEGVGTGAQAAGFSVFIAMF